MPYVVKTPVRDGFGFNPIDSLGLSFAYYSGRVWGADASVASVSHGSIQLASDATNYVERSRDGVVSANTVGFTDGRHPLWIVVTDSTEIVSVEDWHGAGDARPSWSTGTAVPSDADGLDGDLYLRTSADVTKFAIYVKAAGAWGTALVNTGV